MTFPDNLSPELLALIARMDAEFGAVPDLTLLPATEGRARTAEVNRRWNRDMPDMAVAETHVPADAGLGSAATRLRVLTPAGAGAGTLLFVHGGGFAFCSPETHERCGRVLARAAGLPVWMPDYRLAPEHPFPAGLMDVIACLRAASEQGPLVVAGDSAGANLVLAAMLHEQVAGRPRPAGALLFYGVYDADFETASYRRFDAGPGLTRGKMRRYWDWYCADAGRRRDPLAAPLQAADAALAALPPLHLMAAGIDPLLSDTLALADRLQRLGRTETVEVVPGVTHGFLQMTLDLPAARGALAAAGAAAAAMVRQP